MIITPSEPLSERASPEFIDKWRWMAERLSRLPRAHGALALRQLAMAELERLDPGRACVALHLLVESEVEEQLRMLAVRPAEGLEEVH